MGNGPTYAAIMLTFRPGVSVPHESALTQQKQPFTAHCIMLCYWRVSLLLSNALFLVDNLAFNQTWVSSLTLYHQVQ